MPKASKTSASQSEVMEGFEGHYENMAGGYTVGFEEYSADADMTSMYQGLPDDQCQCEHWGYVLKGKIVYLYGDREETYEAGDAYYAPPGHTTILYAGSELVAFSPTDELDRTMEVVVKNMEAASA